MEETQRLPDSSYDLLIKLWARSMGETIKSVTKTRKDEDKHD